MTIKAPLRIHRDKTEGICGATPPADAIQDAVDFRMAKPGQPIRCQIEPGHLPVLQHHNGAVGCWYEEVAEFPPATGRPTPADQQAPTAYERYRDRAERILCRVADAAEAAIDQLDDPLDIPDYLATAMTEAGHALVQLAKLESDREGVNSSSRPIELIGDDGPNREYALLPASVTP